MCFNVISLIPLIFCFIFEKRLDKKDAKHIKLYWRSYVMKWPTVKDWDRREKDKKSFQAQLYRQRVAALT